ncbi:MAG: PAS domain S-box protein [Anaerolineae bacterium]|nr:PAS domain S-box protein [Anaerolineae bacterium]
MTRSSFPHRQQMSHIHPHENHSGALQTPPYGLRGMIATLEYLGDGVLMTDEEGRIIAWNHALEELSGCAAEEMIGRYIWEVQGHFAADPARREEAAEQARCTLQPFFQNGGGEWQGSLIEQDIRTASGEIKTIQYRAFGMPTPSGGWRMGAILRDISQQKAAAARAQESARLLEHRVAERTARLEALTQELEREIEERRRTESELHAQRQFLRAVIDTNRNLMTVKDRQGRMVLANQAMAEFYGVAVEDLIGKTERDFGEDPELSELFAQRLEQVFASGSPLLIEEETIHDCRGRRHILQTRITPLCTPQGEMQALCVSTDITHRVEREREMQAITAISAALRQAKNRAEMLPIILREVCSMVEGRGALLIRRDAAGGDALVVEMGFGELDRSAGDRLPPGQGISARVLESGEPFVTDHLLQEQNFARPWVLDEDLAALCVPYSHGEERSGVLWVTRPAPFTPAEVRLLGTVANIVGNALHRAALHEETARRLQQLNALRAIDMAISVNRDLRSTLDTLLKEVVTQLGADAADILLYEPLTGRFKYAAGIGFRSNFI